jgi:molybdate/tungstate transport system substrate-binding protein
MAKKRFSANKITFVSTGLAACLALAGCGNELSNTANSSNTTASQKTSGTADVAYAGSLQLTNDSYIGPVFTKATGFAYQGYGNGTDAVANLIKSGQITPNVFESIGTGPIQSLGATKADWAIGFASSPLVIAYSNKSPYAKQLSAIAKGKEPIADLFSLMEKPDFHLGRTDPNADPQGQYFVMMMRLAETELKLPQGTANRILGSLENAKQVYSETDILSRLQAGQMDASSAYLPEAIQDHINYIQLPNSINMGDPADAKLYATEHLKIANGQTVTGTPIEVYLTTVNGTPDPSAAASFAAFTLSKQGRQTFRKMGYTLTPLKIWGNQADIPTAVQRVVQPQQS